MNGKWGWVLLSVVVCSSCSTAPKKDLGAERAQTLLGELESDTELASYAPAAMAEARRAVRALEQPGGSAEERAHKAYMAERKIDIARAHAEDEWAKGQTLYLDRQYDQLMVKIKIAEANQARKEAERALMLSQASAEEVERARADAAQSERRRHQATKEAEQMRKEADQARRLASARGREVDLARREAKAAATALASLERELETLQAKQTERGLVVTLGDVLFATAQADLKPEAIRELAELISFLDSYPERSIRVEGHTDSRGSADFNQKLSRQRADSVRQALIDGGVPASRVIAVGYGESRPVASNVSVDGRNQNRRVEVVISQQ